MDSTRVQSQAGKDVLANGGDDQRAAFRCLRGASGASSSGRKTFLDQSLRLPDIPEDCRQTIGLHAPASGARRTLQHRQPQPDGGQVIVHFMKSSRIASAGGIAAAVRGALPAKGLACSPVSTVRSAALVPVFLDAPAIAVNAIRAAKRSAMAVRDASMSEIDLPCMEGVTSAPLPLAPEAIPGGPVLSPVVKREFPGKSCCPTAGSRTVPHLAAAPMRDADGNVIGVMTISFAIRAARHRVAGDGRI